MLREIEGNTAGEFDVLHVTGNADFAGELLVDLDGFVPANSDAFTIIQAGELTGIISNLLPLSRIETGEGFGSFLVDLDTTNDVVVLSDFVVPQDGDFDFRQFGHRHVAGKRGE